MPSDRIDPLFYRPDIGACYCLSDAPDRCRWDVDRHQWVGPCSTRRQWVDQSIRDETESDE